MKILKKIIKNHKNTLRELQKPPVNFISMLGLNKINLKTPKKAGISPGSLIYVGNEKKNDVKIQVIDYTSSKIEEFEVKEIEDVFKYKNKKSITWINITGIHNIEIIKKIGESFKLHPLLLEDVVNTNQRPKYEESENDLFFVLKMISHDLGKNKIKLEQVSIVLGEGFVISFQEEEGDVFEPVRKRIREGKTRIRGLGSDYLTYALIDVIVDNYFNVLEKIGDQVESIEEAVIGNTNSKNINIIYGLKRELILLRKSVWPLREVISGFQRAESRLIKNETKTFIRDLYDHTIQVIDTIETFRDMLSGMIDLNMSITSNKMNEVMKVLTIIATIFIPLTFIAGIYGMNFEYMPELTYRGAYFIVWGVMVLVAAIMVFYFKKKRWI